MSIFYANTSRVEVLESGKKIIFISKTDERFEVPIEYIGCSNLIAESLDMCNDDPNPEISLLNISSPTLIVLIEFMKEYTVEPFETLPKPLPENGIQDCVRPYFHDLCFNLEMVSNDLKKQSKSRIDDDDEDEDNDNNENKDSSIPKTSIVELLHASSFLRIDSLKQLCTAYLAQNLKKKNFMEVKTMFKCDDLKFDYKKMDQLYKDHEWCFKGKTNDPFSSGGGNP
jgi:hypothetical protein